MKNTLEINGFTITVEDIDGVITIKTTFGETETGELSLDPAQFSSDENTEPAEETEETTEDEQNEGLLDFEKFIGKN